MRTRILEVTKFICKLLLVAFCVLCGFVAQTIHQTYKVEETKQKLSEIKKAEERAEDRQGDFVSLSEINPDYAGWLRVLGTKVDYPVVFGETNETYLYRDFYGEENKAGTLFYDETTDFSQKGNCIIYGHKMKDNTMFGSLDKFKEENFFKNNGYVKLEDINGTYVYRIFAVMVLPGNSDSDSFINIQKWNNQLNEEETEKMKKTIKERASIYQEPLKTRDDTFLFLVTCDYSRENGRLVLVARRITTMEGDE